MFVLVLYMCLIYLELSRPVYRTYIWSTSSIIKVHCYIRCAVDYSMCIVIYIQYSFADLKTVTLKRFLIRGALSFINRILHSD